MFRFFSCLVEKGPDIHTSASVTSGYHRPPYNSVWYWAQGLVELYICVPPWHEVCRNRANFFILLYILYDLLWITVPLMEDINNFFCIFVNLLEFSRKWCTYLCSLVRILWRNAKFTHESSRCTGAVIIHIIPFHCSCRSHWETGVHSYCYKSCPSYWNLGHGALKMWYPKERSQICISLRTVWQ